jgi:magnesium transporter
MAAFLYDAEHRDRYVSLVEVEVDELNSEQLLWIDASDERDVAAAATRLGLAEETLTAIHASATEPALFVHEAYVHVVIVVPNTEGPFNPAHVLHCVVGTNWVLTVHAEDVDFLRHFDERIRGDSDLGKLDAYGFLAAILQEHVASYLAELRPLEAELDRIDLRAMTGHIDEEALLRELVMTRLRLTRLRRLLEPHRELFALLARSEFAVLAASHASSDFEALTEFLERALHAMEATREMITSSFEIYTTWTAHETNKVIKRLTVVSVALLPPTLLAGVMGMNSLPATLVSRAAFWFSIAAIAALPLAVLTLAKRRRVI